MTGPRQGKTEVALPAETVAGLAELLTVINEFLHTARASISLTGWLRSRGSPSPEHDASTLIDWLSVTALAFRNLTGGHDSGQHPQERS